MKPLIRYVQGSGEPEPHMGGRIAPTVGLSGTSETKV